MADRDGNKGVSLRKKNRRQAVPGSNDLSERRDKRDYPSQGRPSNDTKRSNDGRSSDGRSNDGRRNNDGRRSNDERSGRDGKEQRSRPRPKPSDSTANMVKKRYSIRYNQTPDVNGQNAPPVPGVPSIPQSFAKPPGSRDGPSQTGGIDKRILRDPNLQADQFVANFLATASEQDLLDYQRDLKKVKNRASTDLQQSVYQNRTQFIKISKEAERLKGEMSTLRGLMSDLTNTLEQAALASGIKGIGFDDSARKRANRSSLANLEAMWNTQLQALWKNIEGSQKFLAAIPGRHVKVDSGGWVELDAATWKSRRPVHIVLLNDYLLVAARKRKRVDAGATTGGKAPTKLVAEHCWALQDIDIIDLTSGAKEVIGPLKQYTQITGAVTVRHGQESFTYRSERPESKQKAELMMQFKLTLDELRRAERSENLENANKTMESMTYLATRDPAVSRSAGLLRTLSKAKDRPEVLIEVDGIQRNLRWIEGQIDELDIEIALQRFDTAVDHVEQLRKLVKGFKGNTVAQDLITAKLDKRASELADILTQQLVHSHAHLTATQQNISYLTRLDFSSRARLAYLSARTSTIQARARQCVFEGNVVAHVTELAFVYFTMIKNTVGTYQNCFPPSMMSACVVWAKERVEAFNEGLERALSGFEKGSEVWIESLAKAKELSGLMEAVGLDFANLVGIGAE